MAGQGDNGYTRDLPSRTFRGSNQSAVRAHNERLVLTLLRAHGPLAKAPVSRLSGLSAQTVSVIMRRLEEEGLLIRGEPLRGKVGQPSIPMHLDPEGALFFGVKIGRRSLDLVLIDLMGSVIARRRMTHPYPEPGAVVRFALESVTSIRAGLPRRQRERVSGLGIAIPFRLWEWARAIGVPAEAMASWQERDIGAEIGAEIGRSLDLRVDLQNDATSACGAELIFGTGSKPADFLYFYIGYFVGGGLVMNGRLVTGKTGNAAAIGTMPVPDPGGGARQLIALASLAGLERRLAQAGHEAEPLWERPSGWDLPPQIVEPWLEEAAHGLAHAAAAAASVAEIEAAMIDGWLPPDLRARLVALTRAQLARIDLAGIAPPRIEEGSVGQDARAIGAASLPLSARFLVDPDALMGAAPRRARDPPQASS